MSQIRAAVSVTKASPTITTPVNLTGSVGTGFMFALSGAREAYFVASAPVWDGNICTVQLTAPFAGDTNSVASGLFVTDYTSPDMIPVINPGDTNTATIFTEAMYRLQKMISAVSPAGLAVYMTAHDEAMSSASAASNSATAASKSAGDASSFASAASNSATAAASSAADAAGSKTVAASAASGASTSATNAANSATAASGSASDSASSAGSSANNATNAANSASSASQSKTDAAASASAAAASASSASSSASSALRLR